MPEAPRRRDWVGVRSSACGILSYLIGIVVGTTVVLVAVASGITAALLALPAIGSVLLGISAAYILWLAYHIATAAPFSAQTAAVAAPSFAGGALLGVAERGKVLRNVPAQNDCNLR
jgi:threonine/homoserine/homoserine lactone efflux protein